MPVVPVSRSTAFAPQAIIAPSLRRSLSHADSLQPTAARPALRRRVSAPADLARPLVAGLQLVQNLQVIDRAAGDLVQAVQAERCDIKVALLSAPVCRDLKAALTRQLHRTGLTIRLAEKLETRVPIPTLDGLTAFYLGPWGDFCRTCVNPLAQALQLTCSGWREGRKEGVAMPPRPAPERRAALDRAMPLVQALMPSSIGDDGLKDALAGLLLERLSRSQRRTLRTYLQELEEKGYNSTLNELAAWTQDACVREGIFGWALARADALNDLAACNRTLEVDGEAVPALKRRAELYLNRLGDPLLALHDMRRLVALDPAPEHWVARATVYIQMERWKDASADLAHAIAMAPQGASAYGWRAMLRFKMGDVAGAQRDLKRAEKRDPYDPDVCHAKLQLDEHSLDLQLREHPSDVEAYLARAVCKGGQRQYAAALADCRRALALAPQNQRALAGCDLYASILGVDAHG